MDAFALIAKITLDSSEYDKNLDKTKNSLSSVASSIGGGLATAAKVGTAAVGAAATAIGVLTKQSIDGYARYEQLVGGSKLMFGSAYDYIADKASNAFKTVQMSQNDYLTQVNGFATGLKTALGGNEMAAAKLADKIVTAEADIVAATGNTQENVQNAFNGIMKNNYTMLDNLGLGINATKEGMQEVIDKTNEWNAANGKATQYNIDNLADCQSALVDYVEMVGMSGYANMEASKTIQGSLASVQSAWSDLITAFSDPEADIGEKIDNLVESGATAFENLMPVIEQALVGIGDFVAQIVPIITEKLPELIEQILPPLIEASMSLVSGLVQALPEIMQGLISAVPTIFESLQTAFEDNASALLDTGANLIDYIAQGFDSADSLIEKGGEVILEFIEGAMDKLPEAIESGTEIINGILEGITSLLPDLIELGGKILAELAEGIMNAMPQIITLAGTIISNLYGTLLDSNSKIFEAGVNLIVKLYEGLANNFPQIASAAIQVIGMFVTTFLTHLPQILETGITLIGKLAAGIIKGLPQIIGSLPQILSAIISWFTSQDWASIGTNIVRGIAGGISSSAGMIVSAAREAALSALNAAKSALGIASPSKEGKKLGKWLVKGIAKGIKDSENEAVKAAEDAANKTLQAARQRLENYKVYRNVDLKAEQTYWNKVRKMLKKGTQARIDADKEYFNAKKTLKQAKKDAKANAKEIATEYKNSYKKVNDELAKDIKKVNDELNEDIKEDNEKWEEERIKATEKATKDIDKIWDSFEKEVKNRGKSIAHSLNLFEGVKYDDKVSKKGLLVNLDEQVTALEKWDMTLDQLGRRIGTDSELFQELAEMGVSALPTLREINDMSNAELNQYMALFEQKNAIAQERARENSEILRQQAQAEQMERETELARELASIDEEHEKYQNERRAKAAETIKELKAEAAQEIKELTAQYKKDLKELAKSLKGQGKPVGKAMIQGITEGLKGSEKILTAASQKAAKEALKAAKKALGIKSPSKEFAEVGKMIDYGMAQGITGNINKVESAMDKLTGATTGSVDVSKTTTGNTMSNNINMNIYGAVGQDVKELAEIVEQRITQSIGVQMRGMAYA